MAGLVPATHVLFWRRLERTWMPGTRPGMTDRSLIRRHDIRHGALELFCGRALAHDAAEGSVARHFRIAPAPGHTSLGVQPDQPLGPLRNAAKDVGARLEIIGAGVAKHDHRRLRR